MAAGDIILSDGTTITPEDLQKIAAETKKILAAESKELSQYEEVSSLSNLTSLPGIFQSGSTMKLVRVALSVLKGIDGKTVEFSASATAIQWRYVGETEWNTLIDIALLKGAKGDAGEKVVFRKGESGIEWKYESEEDTAYKTLVSMDDIKLKYSDLSEADKAELTKKPILATVNAQSGSTPFGSFASDGEDENGNPKYILNLTVQKGDKGEPPVFEVGSVTTGLPSSEASVELTPNGETPEGNPKYIMDISIPKGEPGQNGEGSGNVYATETGLEAGKTYLFRPSAPNSASGTFVLYEAPDTSNFVTSEKLTEELGKKQDSGDYILDAPSDDKQYARKNGEWEEVKAGDTVTKESIENVLTGNIESHTHNSTYEYTEFETDVWDGSTISESLQGTGTKDDPYLIQSCADLLFMRSDTNFLSDAETVKYVRITKSLDFDNHTLPSISNENDGYLTDIDGCNATISNYISDATIGIFGNLLSSFIHNINFIGFTINVDVSIYNSQGSSGINAYTSNDNSIVLYNNLVKGKIIFSGNLEKDLSSSIYIFSDFAAIFAPQIIPLMIQDYYNNNDLYFGSEITIEDNTVKNGFKIMFSPAMISIISVAEVEGMESKNIYGYDNSYSNISGVSEDGSVITDGSDLEIVIQYAYAPIPTDKLYINRDKASGVVYISPEETASFEIPLLKTTEEMLSDSFVEELNLKFSSPVFVKDKNGGTPVLAPKNAKLKYDGYVRQSEFEEFKKNLQTYEPVEPVENPYFEIDLDLTDTLSPMGDDGQIEYFGKTYDKITNENVVEKLGGIDGIRKIIKKLCPLSKPCIVSMPVLIYVIPMRVSFVQYITMIQETKGGNSVPYNQEIPDGSYVQFALYSYTDAFKVQVTVSIEHFNLPEMMAVIDKTVAMAPYE